MVDVVALESFSAELVNAGNEIIRCRKELMPVFAPVAQAAYRRIAGEEEELKVEYQSSVKSNFAVELAQARAKEKIYRVTLIGPHRDEMRISLNVHLISCGRTCFYRTEAALTQPSLIRLIERLTATLLRGSYFAPLA